VCLGGRIKSGVQDKYYNDESAEEGVFLLRILLGRLFGQVGGDLAVLALLY
jgi:hypothetical protein